MSLHSIAPSSVVVPGNGEMSHLIRIHDWSKTAVGSPETWPQSLKTALSICLGSKFPMFVWWGKELTVFYNDAYIPFTGLKHPTFLGRPAREQWAEIWNDLAPLTDHVFQTGEATWAESMLLFMTRKGFLEETYFTFSYSPIYDESGGVGGIINPCQETTEQILGERRLRTLHDLGTEDYQSIKEVALSTMNKLQTNIQDVPFALMYIKNEQGTTAELMASFGIAEKSLSNYQTIDLKSSKGDRWEIIEANKTTKPRQIVALRESIPEDLPTAPYEEKPDAVYVLPIVLANHNEPAAFLVLGISSRLLFDEAYRKFFDLIGKHITTQITNIHTLEEEKKQVEAMQEIDRAKTIFFNNVSHEFRTPLTLMIGPLEDSLHDLKHPLLSEQKVRQEIVYRNALRLLKLVNSLLDFSRIESGKMQASYVPTDLSLLTKTLAGHFESMMAKAGLKYMIDIPPLNELVYVDTDMWEKILLNLISNAFKFTLEGEVKVSLKSKNGFAELTVEDTGVGIPEKEMPNVFKRFYRIEESKGRSFEGSGIGLALVQELVKMHGGEISVKSVPDHGSSFTVKIPLGKAHLPENQVQEKQNLKLKTKQTEDLVNELFRLIPEEKKYQWEVQVNSKTPGRYNILLVDDNPDMRAYIKILLDPFWNVTTASDGEEAYEKILDENFDLVLSDVMMPKLDGFGLIKKLRNNPMTKTMSIILISARAGEEATVVGMESGADDYLVKPFSGNELIARVKTILELKHLREERLKLSERQLNMALSSAQMGAWSWDLKKNIVTRDDLAQKLFGYAPGTCPNTPTVLQDRLHPEDRERTLKAMQEAINKHSSFNVEFRVVWPDKTIHWVQGIGQVFYDDGNNPDQLLGIILEITKRKDDEELLKQAIHARDEFIVIASHELKTPITSLKLQLQMTRRQIRLETGAVPPIDQLARAIDVSTTQVNRLNQLIEDMLDVSRMQSGKLMFELERVNLLEIVLEVAERFAVELSNVRCDLKIDVPENIITRWDKGRIEQVLVNLIANAVKYAPGTELKISATKHDESVTIIVRDEGPGIPEEKQHLLFQRFGRAAPYLKITGLGLGLYISKQIIEAHGGTISMDSAEGKGTSFIIKLPLDVDADHEALGILLT